MTKKIIGLSCGRKNSNCEDFLNAALMAAEEQGVETEIIRLMDLKITPCNSCQACFATGKCAKDDTVWVLEQTMLPDGGRKTESSINKVKVSIKSFFNWAAAAAWVVSVAVSTLLVLEGGVQIYFVSLPGWFVTALLYIGVSKVMQKNVPSLQPQPRASP